MKLLTYILSIILFLGISLYIALFTSFGNSFAVEIVEKKINDATNFKVKINDFILRIDKINITLSLPNKNNIKLNGSYSIFEKSMDLKYNIALKNLNTFSNLAKKKLNGSLFTNGLIKGNIEDFIISGVSNIADSKTDYSINIKNNKPENIVANMQNAKLSEILHIINEKKYAQGRIFLNATLKDFNPEKILGDVRFNIKNGVLNEKIMKNDFNVTIPKTNFAVLLKANLNQKTTYNLDFDSNLAKIIADGNIDVKNLFVNSKYSVDIKKLEMFKPITNAPLRGDIKLSGNFKGDKKSANLKIKSNIAKSDTNLNIKLIDFKPQNIKGKISSLNIQKLLYMIEQPKYAKGNMDINIDIANANFEKLNGKIIMTSKNILPNNQTIKKLYKIDLPKNLVLKLNTVTNLDKNLLKSKASLDSSIFNLKVANSIFDIKDSSIKSDFDINVDNLGKLKFITKQNLRGNIKIKGDIKKDKKIIITASSSTLGGNIKAKIIDNIIQANLDDVTIAKILYMLYYPNIYEGKINGSAKIDTKEMNGNFNLDLKKGHFTKSQMTVLISQLLKTDITNENFSHAIINGNMKKEKINCDIDMQSAKFKVLSEYFKFDTKQQKIDSKLNLSLNNKKFTAKIKGDIKKPKISLDVKDLIKKKVKKEIKKELKKRLDKELGNLFKKFF